MISLLSKDIRLEQVMPLIRERLAEGKKVIFGPKGTSMLPMLRQGIDRVELVAVKGKLKKYDLPFYVRDNGQYVLHRIVKVRDTYTCIGDNQYVYEHGVRQDQIIAVMTGYYRGDEYISAKSWRYKWYCRRWHWTRPIRPLWRRLKGKLVKLIQRKK